MSSISFFANICIICIFSQLLFSVRGYMLLLVQYRLCQLKLYSKPAASISFSVFQVMFLKKKTKLRNISTLKERFETTSFVFARVAPDIRPDIRPFSRSGIRPDIRLAGSLDIRPEKLFKQVKSKTVEQQIKLQYKILNSGRNFSQYFFLAGYPAGSGFPTKTGYPAGYRISGKKIGRTSGNQISIRLQADKLN